MQTEKHIVAAVAEVYDFIDARVAEINPPCKACGKCCDFDGYDHRLFVTTQADAHWSVPVQHQGRLFGPPASLRRLQNLFMHRRRRRPGPPQ